MRAIELEGHDRIGTALWSNSIPPKYKQFPVIGRGSTSIVLDKGDGTVLMLTRDAMKKDWLVQSWGLGIGKLIDGFEAYHQKSRAISDMPVFVIQLPRLFPLSNENKKLIKTAIEQWETVIVFYKRRSDRQQQFNKYLTLHKNGIFARLVEFLQNYDTEQYRVDFLTRNFMQDKKGRIVIVDPIISNELLDVLKQLVRERF